MKKLSTYTDILFLEKEIGEENLGNFGNRHLQAMIDGNGSHQLDDLISQTTPILNNYDAKLLVKTGNLSNRHVATLTVRQYQSQYKGLLSTASSTVLNKCKKTDPLYADFFPVSLSKYSRAHLDDMGNIIIHFIDKFTTHTEYGTAGSNMKNAFTSLKNAFVPAKATQNTDKDNVKTASHDMTVERFALATQLTFNVLTIAAMNLGDPKQMNVFFDTSLLYSHPHDAPTPGAVYTIKVGGLKVQNCKIEGLKGMTILATLQKGNEVKIWSSSSLKKTAAPAIAATLQVNTPQTLKMDNIGIKPGFKHLFTYNTGITTALIEIELTGGIKG